MTNIRPNRAENEHRLEGLEPDNVLGFLALLGLLRALETARPCWRARAAWTVVAPPLRPALILREAQTHPAVAEAATEGVMELAMDHVFDRQKLAFRPEEPRERLSLFARADTARERETARLWSALMSDAAMRPDAEIVERTPFCLLDVAQTAFLKSIREIGLPGSCPRQGKTFISLAKAIERCLFFPWERKYQTISFRWDPSEDSRHAHRWAAPTHDKQGVEHGANVLAVLGLRSLTVVPRHRGAGVRLGVQGGRNDGGFNFCWPIWTERASLQTIEAMLSSPKLRVPDGLAHLGVSEARVTEKRNPNGGKYSNFGRGRLLSW